MSVLLTLLQAIQILSAIGMIGLILMQHGKGADAGAAFGGGAGSASLFGASGGANFLSRSTAALAAVFLACTLGLAYFGGFNRVVPAAGSVLESVTPASQIPDSAGGAAVEAPAVPAVPAPAGAAQIPGQ